MAGDAAGAALVRRAEGSGRARSVAAPQNRGGGQGAGCVCLRGAQLPGSTAWRRGQQRRQPPLPRLRSPAGRQGSGGGDLGGRVGPDGRRRVGGVGRGVDMGTGCPASRRRSSPPPTAEPTLTRPRNRGKRRRSKSDPLSVGPVQQGHRCRPPSPLLPRHFPQTPRRERVEPRVPWRRGLLQRHRSAGRLFAALLARRWPPA